MKKYILYLTGGTQIVVSFILFMSIIHFIEAEKTLVMLGVIFFGLPFCISQVIIMFFVARSLAREESKKQHDEIQSKINFTHVEPHPIEVVHDYYGQKQQG